MKESERPVIEFFRQWEDMKKAAEKGIRKDARKRITDLFRVLQDSGAVADNQQEKFNGKGGETMFSIFYNDDERGRFKHAEEFRITYEEVEAFLFDETLEVNERRERFRMAWGIRETMRSVCLDITQTLLDELADRLAASPDFKEYRIRPVDVSGNDWENALRVYKKAWCHEGPTQDLDAILVSYSLQPTKTMFQEVWAGIQKFDEDYPFEGDWRKEAGCDLFPATVRILCQIWWAFVSAWNSSPEKWAKTNARCSDERWIVRQQLPSPAYRMEGLKFYLMILERGYETVVDDYFRMFVLMKKSTEGFLDRLIERCEEDED